MEKKKIAIALAVALLVAIPGSFYAGMKYQKSKSSSQPTRGQSDQRGQRRGTGQDGQGSGFNRGSGPNGPNGDFVTGEIVSKDDKSVTVKTRDGGSKIIFFAGDISVGKSVEGQVSDLENGKQVIISGKNNTDGTFTAQNIQIRTN